MRIDELRQFRMAGIANGGGGRVESLGHGDELFASLAFTLQDGSGVFGVCKWSNQKWMQLSHGLQPSSAKCLIAFDDGSGPTLFAGGHFSINSPYHNYCVAKLNGQSW